MNISIRVDQTQLSSQTGPHLLFSRPLTFIFLFGLFFVFAAFFLFSEQFSSVQTMADEEPVDQKRYLEEACKPKSVKPLLVYQACVKRIQGDDSGHKHCTGQYFDYWSCIDKCVAQKLFSKLK